MTGVPLFFIPGWATNAQIWRQICARPANYYYDAPQFPDFNHLAASFLKFQPHPGPRGAILVGWSLGGMLALELAHHFPAQIEKVILVGSTACFIKREDYAAGLPPVLVKRLLKKLRLDCRETQRAFYRLMFSPAEQKEAQTFAASVAPLMSGIPEATLAHGLAYLLDTDLRPLLPRITVPCHIIHGLADGICPFAAGQYMAAQLPRARLHSLAAGHIPFYTRPAEFQALLEECIHRDQ